MRALTYENLSLTDYRKSLPFVQRVLNSDRLKISSSQLLFGNALQLDRGIFLPVAERQPSTKPLSKITSDLLRIQDNLLKASAKELLRTDLLHMTSKEQNTHEEYPVDSYVLVHYRTVLAWSYESYQRIKFPIYTSRPYNWQREGLSCIRHEAFCL